MSRDGIWTSWLLYGLAGSGKSAFGVSSFWDWQQRKVIGKGRWITIGRENNPALMVPASFRKAGNVSLRLRAPALDDTTWLKDFEEVMTALLSMAKAGEHLDGLVFDGWSEFDLLFENTFVGSGADRNIKKFEALLNNAFAIASMLDPEELGCHVFTTARVMERRKQHVNPKTGTTMGEADPEYMSDYYPAFRGKFRYDMPNYHNMVMYMELKEGHPPTHLMHMLKTGDYLIKNSWEHAWKAANLPEAIENPTFPQVWHLLNSILETPEVK